MPEISTLSIIMTEQAQQQYFKELGERIAQLRKSRGWSQAGLGKEVGLSQQMIADYESGQKLHLPLCRILDLAEALQVDVTELLGTETEAGRKPGPSSKMERQISQVRRLPKSKQKFVSEFLDTILQQQAVS